MHLFGVINFDEILKCHSDNNSRIEFKISIIAVFNLV